MLNGATGRRTFRLVVILIVYDSRIAEFSDQLVVGEFFNPGLIAEELFLDVGEHRLFPDEADPRCVQRADPAS